MLGEVSAFLRRTGMEPSVFGRRAVGAPRFVGDLRRGRDPRPGTRDKVARFIAAVDKAGHGAVDDA